MMKSKICYSCNQQKQLTAFVKGELHVGGYSNLCKECKLERQRIRRRLISKQKKESGQFNIRRKEPVPDNHKKKCSKCLTEKDFTEFYKSKVGKWGISPQCIVCRKQVWSLSKLRNLEKFNKRQKIYRESHREEFKKYNKKYSSSEKGKKTTALSREKNRQKINSRGKVHRQTTKYKERYKQWCQKNKDKTKKYTVSYWSKNYESLIVKYRALSKKKRDNLSDDYIKAYLKYWYGISEVTKELIEIKREQIKLSRKIKKHEKQRNTFNI